MTDVDKSQLHTVRAHDCEVTALSDFDDPRGRIAITESAFFAHSERVEQKRIMRQRLGGGVCQLLCQLLTLFVSTLENMLFCNPLNILH